jgi:hypothetical protein
MMHNFESDCKPCQVCEERFNEDELEYGVCAECFEEKRFDVEFCYGISKAETESIEINSFVAAMFSADEIEAILMREIRSAEKVDCSPFIEGDKMWFAEALKEACK